MAQQHTRTPLCIPQHTQHPREVRQSRPRTVNEHPVGMFLGATCDPPTGVPPSDASPRILHAACMVPHRAPRPDATAILKQRKPARQPNPIRCRQPKERQTRDSCGQPLHGSATPVAEPHKHKAPDRRPSNARRTKCRIKTLPSGAIVKQENGTSLSKPCLPPLP